MHETWEYRYASGGWLEKGSSGAAISEGGRSSASARSARQLASGDPRVREGAPRRATEQGNPLDPPMSL